MLEVLVIPIAWNNILCCRILQDYREHWESIVRDEIESLTLNGQNKLQDTDVNALSIANKIWIPVLKTWQNMWLSSKF